MNNAIHFGAGNIGRGFIGKLLADAGIKVNFVDVNTEIVTALHQQHRYPVKIAANDIVVEWVENVDAILSSDPKLTELFIDTDLITTSVGPNVLPHIATNIASGLVTRYTANQNKPLNIIACENMLRATSNLKQLVLAKIDVKYHTWIETNVGFVDSAVDRIVPAVKASDNILEVTVEEFSEWIVDQTQFKGSIPTIAGMETTDNLMAFIERKLFTLNTGHAITAYLSCLANLATIRDGILQPEIRAVVKAAMQESGDVLIKRYGFASDQHQAYIEKILSRFANKYIDDEVDRVARQPLRKLSKNERLIKPLLGTLEYAIPHSNLIKGIVAALHYRNSQDEQAELLKAKIETLGLEQAIYTITELTAYPNVVQEIISAYNI